MAKTTHPAFITAQGFYEELRRLEQHEQRLLIDVRMAGHDRARVIGSAIKDFGDGSDAYHATVFLADRSHDDALDRALAKYRAEHERLDQGFDEELELIAYHMSEAAE